MILKHFVYETITLYGQAFQLILLYLILNIVVLQPQVCRNKLGLGFFPFARHYLGNHYCFLLLRLLRCFSSARSLLLITGLQPDGFPHSEISGS
jgi:hypothetical protein